MRRVSARLLLGDDGHEGGNLLGLDLRVLDLLAVAVRRAVLLARAEVFGIWHPAGARREARDGRREEKRRSAVGGSDGKNARADASRVRPSVRNPGNARAPEVPSRRLRGRVPPRFQVSGFWGSIRRRRTFLGLVLVWPLVALGLTCVAARTTRRTGAPIMTAMFLCVEWRERGAARSEGSPDADRAIVIEKAEN